MKCGYRDCHNTAIGRLEKGGKVFIRCQHHESQYKSNNKKRIVWSCKDVGFGKCSRAKCDKFATDSNLGLCDMHEYYRDSRNKKAYHKLPEYQERARKRNASNRLEHNRSKKIDRPDKDYAGMATLSKSTGDKFLKLCNARLDEIYG